MGGGGDDIEPQFPIATWRHVAAQASSRSQAAVRGGPTHAVHSRVTQQATDGNFMISS